MGISWYSLKHFWKKPIFIDLILLFFFIICIVLSVKFSGKLYIIDYNSFFLNLSTCLISVWITVRIIESLIIKREKLRDARRTLLENLKHPYVYIDNIYSSLNQRDLDYLKRNNKWFDNKWGNGFYITVLKDKEWPIAQKLIGLNMQILTEVHNVVIHKNMNNSNNIKQDEELLERSFEMLRKKMLEIETEIEKLQTEMWKTDKPVPL